MFFLFTVLVHYIGLWASVCLVWLRIVWELRRVGFLNVGVVLL